MRTNRSVRFGFGGLTVLLARCGDQVSFYTTVGDVLLKDKPQSCRGAKVGYHPFLL
jgi:hypothetical protein